MQGAQGCPKSLQNDVVRTRAQKKSWIGDASFLSIPNPAGRRHGPSLFLPCRKVASCSLSRPLPSRPSRLSFSGSKMLKCKWCMWFFFFLFLPSENYHRSIKLVSVIIVSRAGGARVEDGPLASGLLAKGLVPDAIAAFSRRIDELRLGK